jgi:RNA polymerase sigma-70 factor (ECF subfamily)
MNPMTPDEEMAEAVQNGNTQAAHVLMSRHRDGVYGMALRMLRNSEDAAEVTQEALYKALSRIDSYDPSRPFAPWLYRIARNLCVDRHRRRRPTSELHEETTAAPDLFEGGARFGRRADDVVQQRELNHALGEAMGTLGEKYREIIVLYHYDHMTYREIAEHLDLPDGTVMNRLFRARRKLQAALLERGITP